MIFYKNDGKEFSEKKYMQKQNKIMIFDMDGVILDSEPLRQNARKIRYKK